MSWLLLLIIAYPTFYSLQCLFRMGREWYKAYRSGIPYVLVPVHPENILWMVFSPVFRKQLERYLPTFLYSRLSMTIYGWECRYKYSKAEEFGPLLLITNFYRSELTVCDPDVAHDILKRPKDFPNSEAGNFIMGKFGPNLVTSDNADWARQRKFIAPNINERISATVWTESLNQAKQMMDHVAANGGTTNECATGMKKIAINVLGLAGYGQSRPWNDDKAAESAPKGFHLTYMQAMRLLVENLVEMAFLSPSVLLLPFWPKNIVDTGYAVTELKGLTEGLLDGERNSPSRAVNIMKLLIEDEGAEKTSGTRLQPNEIVGNLFVFSAAGFDTTANTMLFCLALLAVHPQWQGWIFEELDEILPENPDTELDYNECYPRLLRIQALMHETLRFFAPIVHLAKRTRKPEPVTMSNGKQVIIPGNTTVYINSSGLQHNPNVWPDPLRFNPDRWLAYPETEAGKGGQAFIKPAPKGSFVAWSTGPRACPGQKMSQVEFVGVFAQILRGHRIEVVLKKGETAEQGRQRAEEIMNDITPKLTTQMTSPTDLELRFVRR